MFFNKKPQNIHSLPLKLISRQALQKTTYNMTGTHKTRKISYLKHDIIIFMKFFQG